MPKKHKKIKKNKAKKIKASKKASKKIVKKHKKIAKAKKAHKVKAVPPPKPKKLDKKMLALERLVGRGKERGYVTYDEILKEFPTIEEDITFLDELYEKMSVAGVDILEGGGLLDSPAEE